MPEEGYTAIVEKILDHPGITVRLATPFHREMEQAYDHTFYTGMIDAYFEFGLGRLGYRTITFERIDGEGDYQGNAVINYTELAPAYTRIHEHKHFTPWEKHDRTVAFREFSKETGPEDTAYYPKRVAVDRQLLMEYRRAAEKLCGVSFVGRLGTYRYLDMDAVIDEALSFSSLFIESRKKGAPPPLFPNQEDRVS
jgi:UDP-galactopyranose mutase